MPTGAGKTYVSGSVATWPSPPPASSKEKAETRSPTRTRLTPSPTAATTPDISLTGM